MTTADVSLVAKESIVVEKLKKKHAVSFFLSDTVSLYSVLVLVSQSTEFQKSS